MGKGMAGLAMVAGLLITLASAEPGAGWRNDGSGRFVGVTPPQQWSKQDNIGWRVALPGSSLASPVVIGERVFVTSDPSELLCCSAANGQLLWQRSHEYADVFPQEKAQSIEADLKLAEETKKQRESLQREREEAKKAGNTKKQSQLENQIEALQQRYRELTVYPPKPGDNTGNSTSTPVSDGKNIYAVYATGVVSSHTLDGDRNWITYIEGGRGDHSSSPLLVDGKLILHLGDLVAVDVKDGTELWRAESNERHGSPVAARVGKQFMVVTASGDVIRTSDGRFVAKRQFQLGHNSPIVEGDVVYTLEEGAIKAWRLPHDLSEETKLELEWESANARANQLASPIVHEGLLYGVSERGILTVTDAKTGKKEYRKRLDVPGGRIDASLCLAGDLLYVSTTGGLTLVLRTGREFEQVAQNELEGFSSSLAFAGNRMFLRTRKELICVEK